MDIANDIHLYKKDVKFENVRFKFISSIDELLDYHPFYVCIYRWLNKMFASSYWNLLDYTKVINTGVWYYFYVTSFKHPEVEWPDIENDFLPMIREDVDNEDDKFWAVVAISCALLYVFTPTKEFFREKYIMVLAPNLELFKELIYIIVESFKICILPQPQILLHLDDVNTKRLLKIHGSHGCYILHTHLDEKTDRKVLEEHMNEVISSLFSDYEEDGYHTNYYFRKLGYAVLETNNGFIYDPSFYEGCLMDKYIVSFEDSEEERSRKRKVLSEYKYKSNYIKDNTSTKGHIHHLGSGTTTSSATNPLKSSEAQVLLEKARQAGLVDEKHKPKVSHYKASILASIMGELLKLNPLWGPFEKFWGIKDMTNKYSQAKLKKYYSGVYKEYKSILA